MCVCVFSESSCICCKISWKSLYLGWGGGKRSYFRDITLTGYDAYNNSVLPVDVSV